MGTTMQIKWIEFERIPQGLHIEKIEFNQDISLLVGLSGAGKTQILRAVAEVGTVLLQSEAMPVRPAKARMAFCINDEEYLWEYKLEMQSGIDTQMDDSGGNGRIFSYERLQKGSRQLFIREGDKYQVHGYEKIPKPKPEESLISQYKENEEFSLVYLSFSRIVLFEPVFFLLPNMSVSGFDQWRKWLHDALETIRQTGGDRRIKLPEMEPLPAQTAIPLRLYAAKEYSRTNLYARILSAIQQMFPEIEEISYGAYNTEICEVSIRAYDTVIWQQDISNGMLKALYFLIYVYTLPKGTVICMDEVENGLGINCMETIIKVMKNCKDAQFILTSHHPSVLNGITSDRWKIIDRIDNKVTNSDDKQYGLAGSLHDNYYTLLNRWSYEGKI